MIERHACNSSGMLKAAKSAISNATRMRSFRVSETLDELIKRECSRRHTDFSSFMRDAAIDAMCARTDDGEATL